MKSLGTMMSATAEDYAWVDDWYDSVGQAYCLTLARGLVAGEFLARVGAVPDRRVAAELARAVVESARSVSRDLGAGRGGGPALTVLG